MLNKILSSMAAREIVQGVFTHFYSFLGIFFGFFSINRLVNVGVKRKTGNVADM